MYNNILKNRFIMFSRGNYPYARNWKILRDRQAEIYSSLKKIKQTILNWPKGHWKRDLLGLALPLRIGSVYFIQGQLENLRILTSFYLFRRCAPLKLLPTVQSRSKNRFSFICVFSFHKPAPLSCYPFPFNIRSIHDSLTTGHAPLCF